MLRGNKQLSKNSPLALATSNGKTMAIFYLQSEGRSKTIYSLNYMPGTEISKLSPIRIGKLEPDSVLGAASFKSGRFDSRLFSVSNLDGDNILLERVPKEVVLPAGSIQRKEKLAWVISGGVVETDVDHLVAQVTPQEEDSDSD